MMLVKALKWVSVQAKEAELLISDGSYECIAFSQPCEIREGDVLDEPLHAFIVTDIMISTKSNGDILLINQNGLQQHCTAQIMSIEFGLVKIGNISIIIEEVMPLGVYQGDFIEFNCARLDVW